MAVSWERDNTTSKYETRGVLSPLDAKIENLSIRVMPPSMSSFTVSVPATTANIGPGFDCLGAALTLHNHVTFTALPEAGGLEMVIRGRDADKISTDTDNLLYQAIVDVFNYIQQPVPGLKLTVDLEVPLSRGLGSSATAIVAGLVGANQWAGNPLSLEELLHLAVIREGHPDNVAPALLGGCQLAVDGALIPLTWPAEFVPVVAIPEFELSTEAARSVLPSQYGREAAIFNASHLALFVEALQQGREDWLAIALQDKIHQPYRQKLILGFEQLHAAAIQAGAYNLVISGAGPTLLAITSPDVADSVADVLVATWKELGVVAESLCLEINPQGATVKPA